MWIYLWRTGGWCAISIVPPSIFFLPGPRSPSRPRPRSPSPLLSFPAAAAPPPRRRPDAATPPRRRETPRRRPLLSRRRRPAAFPTEKEEEEGALAVDLARPTPVARPTRHRPAALVAGGPDAAPSTPPSPEHHHHPDLVASSPASSSSPTSSPRPTAPVSFQIGLYVHDDFQGTCSLVTNWCLQYMLVCSSTAQESVAVTLCDVIWVLHCSTRLQIWLVGTWRFSRDMY